MKTLAQSTENGIQVRVFQKKFFMFMLILLLSVFSPIFSFGQNQCSSPATISLDYEGDTTLQKNGYFLWIKLTSTSQSDIIKTLQFNNSTNLLKSELFGGDCNNLTLIDSTSSNVFELPNLNSNSNYYLKLTYSTNNQQFVIISASKCPSLIVNLNVSEIEICNNDSILITDGSSDFCNNIDFLVTLNYNGFGVNDTFITTNSGFPSFYKTFDSVGTFYIVLKYHPLSIYYNWDKVDSVLVTIIDTVAYGFI